MPRAGCHYGQCFGGRVSSAQCETGYDLQMRFGQVGNRRGPRIGRSQAGRFETGVANCRMGGRRGRSRPDAAGSARFANEGQEDRKRGFPSQGGQETHRRRQRHRSTDG